MYVPKGKGFALFNAVFPYLTGRNLCKICKSRGMAWKMDQQMNIFNGSNGCTWTVMAIKFIRYAIEMKGSKLPKWESAILKTSTKKKSVRFLSKYWFKLPARRTFSWDTGLESLSCLQNRSLHGSLTKFRCWHDPFSPYLINSTFIEWIDYLINRFHKEAKGDFFFFTSGMIIT